MLVANLLYNENDDMPTVAGVEYPYTPEGIAAAQQAERQIGKMGPVGSDIGRGGGGGFGGLVGDPFISPGLLEMARQRQQPTFRDVSHRPQSGQDWLRETLGAGGGVSGPSLENILQLKALQEMMGQRQSQAAGIADQYRPQATFGAPIASPSNPNWGQPTNFGQLIGRSIGGLPQIPSPTPGLDPRRGQSGVAGQSPWPPVQRPITQAPRGRTIQTTNPGAGYGQSPSGPTAQRPRQPANYGRSPSNPNWTPGG